MKTEFPTLLSTLRKNAKLTNIQLAEQANVSRSLIPGLQSGKRCIGEYQARKLGTALKLSGNDMDEFIYCAINNCTEKVLKESLQYPAELLNLAARLLRQAGIGPEAIRACAVNEAIAEILLNDGKRVMIETTLEMKAA